MYRLSSFIQAGIAPWLVVHVGRLYCWKWNIILLKGKTDWQRLTDRIDY
jgi:hypothetical protein